MAVSATLHKRRARTAKSLYGMVSTSSGIATRAGVRMLEKGGNAVDAAVASAFCLGVTEPQASGLGGQSMVLLYLYNNGKPLTIALDGSSRAPFAINPNSLPKRQIKVGVRASTVPSTPATLGYLLETYGTLPLEEVLKPSILAAKYGFNISALQRKLLDDEKKRLKEDDTIRSVFFKNGKLLKAGDIAYQPQLAACLEEMAREGWRDFYLGNIGEHIVIDMKRRRGLISRADLNQIPLPVERRALNGSYRGHKVVTFPPPGAGRALVQVLNILERFDPEKLFSDTTLYYLLLAMSFRAALVKRERLPIDPTLYPQLGDKWMVDKDCASHISMRIKELLSYVGYQQIELPPTSGETTHLSAADSFGNIVGITQSIELLFGAKTMSPDLGFFYNNYMSAFDYKNMMHPNYLIPGGRPYSSVAPTIIFRKNGKPYLILGSPGSERISTTLAQVITRVIDGGQSLYKAIDAPRLHAGSSGNATIEKRGWQPELVEMLNRVGFQVSSRGAYSFYLGSVQAVELPEAEGDNFIGVCDPRRDGNACGPNSLCSVKEEV